MEPVTTTAMIATVVGYLAKTLKDEKPIQSFFSEFTEATVNWIKPLFIKDDEPTDVLKNLQEDPADDLNQSDAQNAITRNVRKTDNGEQLLQQMYAAILQKQQAGESIAIEGKNIVNQSDLKAGGSIIIGDGNTLKE